MNNAISSLTLAASLIMTTASAFAAQPVDNYATVALTTARYDQVVTQLEPLVLRDRSDESLLLNLAMAYRHTGRSAEADALYRRVLLLDDAELDTADGGTISSHVVARRALANQAIQISQR